MRFPESLELLQVKHNQCLNSHICKNVVNTSSTIYMFCARLLDMLNNFFDTFVVDTCEIRCYAELYWGSLGYAKEARWSSGFLGGLLGGHVFNFSGWKNKRFLQQCRRTPSGRGCRGIASKQGGRARKRVIVRDWFFLIFIRLLFDKFPQSICRVTHQFCT